MGKYVYHRTQDQTQDIVLALWGNLPQFEIRHNVGNSIGSIFVLGQKSVDQISEPRSCVKETGERSGPALFKGFFLSHSFNLHRNGNWEWRLMILSVHLSFQQNRTEVDSPIGLVRYSL
jgi:hypothetical protein